jgi:hypothetical protein
MPQTPSQAAGITLSRSPAGKFRGIKRSTKFDHLMPFFSEGPVPPRSPCVSMWKTEFGHHARIVLRKFPAGYRIRRLLIRLKLTGTSGFDANAKRNGIVTTG